MAVRWAVDLHDVGMVELGKGHEPFQLLQPGGVLKIKRGWSH